MNSLLATEPEQALNLKVSPPGMEKLYSAAGL